MDYPIPERNNSFLNRDKLFDQKLLRKKEQRKRSAAKTLQKEHRMRMCLPVFTAASWTLQGVKSTISSNTALSAMVGMSDIEFFSVMDVVVVVLGGGSYFHNGMNGEVFVMFTDALLDHINNHNSDSPLSL